MKQVQLSSLKSRYIRLIMVLIINVFIVLATYTNNYFLEICFFTLAGDGFALFHILVYAIAYDDEKVTLENIYTWKEITYEDIISLSFAWSLGSASMGGSRDDLDVEPETSAYMLQYFNSLREIKYVYIFAKEEVGWYSFLNYVKSKDPDILINLPK